MAGHSKWAKIKREKAAADAARSKIFAKLARAIAVESRKARGDASAPGLRLAIEKARAANMPSENIERAIARGSGAGAEAADAVLYEAYGPGGCALLIEALTDNRNRTTAELKHLLASRGGTLAEPGAALWAFRKGEKGWEAAATVSISPEDKGRLEDLLAALEEHDDVQGIRANAA